MLGLLVPICMVALTANDDKKPASEKQKIEALIKHVEEMKGATFVRNDKEYTAANAAKFLRAKWKSNDQDVKTAKDFIAKVASVSSSTGKPYLIRRKDGKETKSGEYLSAELKKLDETPKERPKS